MRKTAQASDEQLAAALAEVDRLIAEGLTARDACELAARRHNIPDARRRTGAQFLQTRWTARLPAAAPTRARAGRRKKTAI
jgi:hypothetical protein